MQKITFLGILLICCQVCITGQNLSANSTGSFTFIPQFPINRPPVEVFYHIPEGDLSTMPILMSFHGAERDGATYRDYWINMANANGFMVFAPQFSSTNYPGLGDNYIMSNIFDDGDNPTPETYNDSNEWTCSVLDPLFEYIKADISGAQTNYSAWGHSAGAQFLHRLFMYLPDSKIDVAVCSNAGWYTVPEYTVSFPYGLLNGELPNSNLVTAFSKKLIIHLGQNDNDPNAPGLRRNSIVDNQQGIHRLERGQYFFSTSETEALNQNYTFNWEKYEVPKVGHNGQLMANDALQYLLPYLLSTTTLKERYFSLSPNPTNSGFVTITTALDDTINVEVFDMSGKQVKKAVIQPDTNLDVSNLRSGIYIVRLEQNNATTTKKLVIK